MSRIAYRSRLAYRHAERLFSTLVADGTLLAQAAVAVAAVDCRALAQPSKLVGAFLLSTCGAKRLSQTKPFTYFLMRKRIGQLLDTAAVFRYHRQQIRECGAGSAGALGWHPEGQQIRFKILAQIGDLAHCSVLDVGCGYADLYPYLKQHFAGVAYSGIEQMPELLDVALARYRHAPNIALGVGDFLTMPLLLSDYVLASGSLNYRQRHPQFIYQAIEKLFAGCRLGLGFNLLSWEPAGGGPLAAYDPAAIVAFCKKLSPNVVLVENYWDGDFTVFVYR